MAEPSQQSKEDQGVFPKSSHVTPPWVKRRILRYAKRVPTIPTISERDIPFLAWLGDDFTFDDLPGFNNMALTHTGLYNGTHTDRSVKSFPLY